MVTENKIPKGLFDLPSFPTVFTQEDLERRRELGEQRRAMEQIYQSKFSQQAWEGTSWFEKAIRSITPPFLSGAVQALTPWEQGAWDYGFTPEQFQQQVSDVEAEYKELSRKEKVVNLLPNIQAGIMVAALQGTPILDTTELLSTFPELRYDFTEEELDYLSKATEAIAHARPEDILSGEALASVSEQDLQDLLREASPKDIRFILSTVAFSRDLNDIGQALKEAYPPQVEEPTTDGEVIKQLTEYYRQLAIDQGIITPDEELNKDTIAKLHAKIAEESGELLVLTDSSNGSFFSGIKKADNTVWVDNEIIGCYEEGTGNIVPVDLAGNPLATEQEQENFFKDMWDSLFYGMFTAKQSFLAGLEALKITSLGGVGDLPASLPASDFVPLTDEEWNKITDERTWVSDYVYGRFSPLAVEVWRKLKKQSATPEEAVNKMKNWLSEAALSRERTNAQLQTNYDARQQQLIDWYKEHPTVLPDPKYETFSWSHLLDPRWWSHTILSNAPATVTALSIGTITAVATGNPVLGAVAGAITFTPLEIGSLYDNLIASGASPVSATQMATGIGTVIGAIEVVPEFIFLKAVSPMFMRMFRKNVETDLLAMLPKALSMKGLLATAGKIEIAETLEEITQEIIHNAAVKTVNENQSIFANLDQTAIQTLVATLPFAGFGAGSQYVAMKSLLPLAIQQEIDKTKGKLVDAGLREVHAEAVAVSHIISTETGQAVIQEAAEKVIIAFPDMERVRILGERLTSYNEQVDTMTSSIKAQRERLAKMKSSGQLASEQLEQVNLIKEMEVNLAELEKSRLSAQNKLTQARKTVVPAEEKPSVSDWDNLSQEARTDMAKKAGIASTTAYSKWADLTDVQQRRLFATEAPLRVSAMKEERTPTRVTEFGKGYTLEELSYKGIPDLTFSPTAQVPRLPPLDVEMAGREEALNRGGYSLYNDSIIQAKNKAQETIDSFKQVYESSDKSSEESQENIAKNYKELTKGTKLKWKDLLGKSWDELPPATKRILSLAQIPDGSLKFKLEWRVFDSRYVFADWGMMTGEPFLPLYERTRTAHGYVLRLQDQYLERLTKNPKFRHIISDQKAMERVTIELNSRDPESGLSSPENITPEEKDMADAIEDVYREWQPIVRHLRFTEAYDHSHDVDSIQEAIPDAPREDLEAAKKIYETDGEDALWIYLSIKDWGVRKSGYDPRRISKPNLELREPPLRAMRGASYLLSRETPGFPIGQEKGLLRRLDSYNRSMATRWFMRRELDTCATFLEETWSKWSSPEEIKSYMKGYFRELQGIPQQGGILDFAIRRMQRIAYPVIFMHPFLGLRNVVQPLWAHPDRLGMVSSLVSYHTLPESLKEEARLRFRTVIDQSARPLRDFMFQESEVSYLGEMPTWLKVALIPLKLVTTPVGLLSRLAAKIPTMSFTDKVSRNWGFRTSLVKAWGATEQYNKDKNLDKWIKSSGLTFLTQEQQKYILGIFLQDQYSWAIPGLQTLDAQHAACIKIAEDITNATLYMYDRSGAAEVHWEGKGRTYASLLIFPRSTLQLYSKQLGRVFSKESSVGERYSGIRYMVLLWLTGSLLSSGLTALSGRRRDEYSLLGVLSWEVGGLSFGLAQDVSGAFSDLITAAFGNDEDKARVMSQLPVNVSRLGDSFVGFWKIGWDIAEAAAGEEKGMDVRFFRNVRDWFDKNYTTEEQEKLERNTLEIFQKILAGSDPADPTVIEEALINLKAEELQLGIRQVGGRYYTLGDFGSKINNASKTVPDYVFIEEAGWSELTLFYKECSDMWAELFTLPSTKRDDWRKTHVLEEAMLLFWEKYDGSVFTQGSKEGNEVVSLLRIWFDQYNIDSYKHSHWANWSLPTKPLTIE